MATNQITKTQERTLLGMKFAGILMILAGAVLMVMGFVLGGEVTMTVKCGASILMSGLITMMGWLLGGGVND